MSEPASRDDLEAAKEAIIKRINSMDDSVNNMRDQNSAEHGSLFSKQSNLTNLMNWLKDAWIRFTIMSPPPEDKPPK